MVGFHRVDFGPVGSDEITIPIFELGGDPVEIDYTLTFYRESIADKGRIPQEAAKKVLAISAAIIAVGAVLNHFVKRRRR